jgi:hypothetical protein
MAAATISFIAIGYTIYMLLLISLFLRGLLFFDDLCHRLVQYNGPLPPRTLV